MKSALKHADVPWKWPRVDDLSAARLLLVHVGRHDAGHREDAGIDISDRIAVLYEGRFVATLSAEEATPEELGLLMAGVKTSPIHHTVSVADHTEAASKH